MKIESLKLNLANHHPVFSVSCDSELVPEPGPNRFLLGLIVDLLLVTRGAS